MLMSFMICPSLSNSRHVINSIRYTTALSKLCNLLINSSLDLSPVYFTPKYFTSSKPMETCTAIKPPARVKGMTKWDKMAFNDSVSVPYLLCPKDCIDDVRKLMYPLMVKLKRFSSIVDLNSNEENYKTHRLILLDPSKVSNFNSLPEETIQKLNGFGVEEGDFETRQVEINHENWTFTDIIRAIVPDEIEETSSGFSEIGHIAHFNLRDEMLPYKHVVGEALLESAKRLKTVVNKTNMIDNTYRTFQLELLAGENNYITQIKESNCVFEMDFSKVYWNSRLGTEHARVVAETKPGDVVFDVFAGIGPFALPCAKRQCKVFANDLNPVSHEYLEKNRQKNKIKEDRLKTYCLDGRKFIETNVKDELIKLYTEGSIYCEYRVHIVMNLPALAVTFVDAFQSLLKGESVTVEAGHEPIVYCYCFTDISEANDHWNGDTKREVKERVRKLLPMLSLSDISLRFVRNVAPKKDMMCVNFVLRNDILFGVDEEKDKERTGEPPGKCRKLEEGRSDL